MKSQILPIVAVAGLLSMPDATATEGPTPDAEVRLVQRPVLVDELTPGACEGLGREAIRIREDGAETTVIALDPRPGGTVHAVLVDAGMSMLDHLQGIRRAAGQYFRSLPPGEQALLATYDDRLLLQAPLTTDRGELARSLQWIEVDRESYFWQSTRRMIHYLGSRQERKVLLVLTRGCDTQRFDRVPPEEVIALAESIDSLAVYVIALKPPARCEVDGEDPLVPLRKLARRTGGAFYAISATAQFPAKLQAIRERLEREMYVSYQPLAFGKGPKDDPSLQDYTWRKLQIEARELADCRVSFTVEHALYSSDRAERRAGWTNGTVPQPLVVDVAAGRMSGVMRDRTAETARMEKALLDLFDGPQARVRDGWRNRDVTVLVPPLAQILGPGSGPEGVMIHMLTATESADTSPWSPFVVDGRTMIDAREPLAHALGSHPDYSRWAVERARAKRIRFLDSRIEGAVEDGSSQTLRKVREIVAGPSWVPAPHETDEYLGAWLGDVSVSKLFTAAESWLAGRLLDQARCEGVDGMARAFVDAEERFDDLQVWFPLDDGRRLLGVLVPGYDSAQQAVGYYRAILRPPTSVSIVTQLMEGDPQAFVTESAREEETDASQSLYAYLQSFNFSPRVPLGVRLMRWVLQQDDALSALDGYELRRVRYVHPTDRDISPLLAAVIRTESGLPQSLAARQVALDLEDAAGQEITLSAYIPAAPGAPGSYLDHPACLVLPKELPPDGAGELISAMVAGVRRLPWTCVVREAR